MQWAEISISAAQASSDAVAQALMDHGCYGVAETCPDPAFSRTTAWLPADDLLASRLAGLRERLSSLDACGLSTPTEITVRTISDPDWLSEWRRHHKPRAFGRRLVICPSWEQPEAEPGREIVLLDPGMAFGTGGHPTTRLCLEALDELVLPGMIVADVGCGSGILAIAAIKLGAEHVYASEIDALPRRIAADNAARNDAAHRITIMTPEELAARKPSCDLVVCNIIAETIVTLAPLLAALIASRSGTLIVSGIVEERFGMVVDALERQGLKTADMRADDVWRAAILRPGSRP